MAKDIVVENGFFDNLAIYHSFWHYQKGYDIRMKSAKIVKL